MSASSILPDSAIYSIFLQITHFIKQNPQEEMQHRNFRQFQPDMIFVQKEINCSGTGSERNNCGKYL